MKKNVRFRVNRALSLDLDQTEESSSMKYQIVKLIQYLEYASCYYYMHG